MTSGKPGAISCGASAALLAAGTQAAVRIDATIRRGNELTQTSRLTGSAGAMGTPQEGDRLLFSGQRFAVVERAQRRRDGSLGAKQVVVHNGAVVIIPMVDDAHVCLIRNERAAVGKWLVELPAGTLEPPEPPDRTAPRELQEETGYTARKWTELPGFFMSPGILCERMHVFVAEALTAGDPAREAGENIDNLVVTWAEALAMIDRGDIEDGKTVAALLVWDRRRRQMAAH
jgi:ADP-ribose pyrophosphatase